MPEWNLRRNNDPLSTNRTTPSVASQPAASTPSTPEQIGIDRREWAGYSPRLRKALLSAKLPDLSSASHDAIINQFALAGGGYDGPSASEVASNGPPPASQQTQQVPPTSQATQAPAPAPVPVPAPVSQEMPVPPAGAASWGPPPGWQQVPQWQVPAGYTLVPASQGFMQPAGQVSMQPTGQAQGGPQYPPTLGWFVLGGAMLVTAWMLWEVTRMKSELQHRR